MIRLALKHLLLLAGLGGALAAQAPFDPEKDVSLAVKGGVVQVGLPAGIHATSLKVSLKAGSPGTLKAGPLPAPQGKDALGTDYWLGMVKVPLKGQGLKDPVTLVVRYMTCEEGEGGVCYPPVDRELKVAAAEIPADAAPADAKPVEPAAIANPGPAPAAQAASSAASAPTPAPASGLLGLLLVAFLAGLGASLTPCVYPMIPITMAIIGAKGGGKARGFVLSLALVLGMAVTYTLLGVVAASSGAAFGAFAQRPAFLIPVSILFAVFALSLFGAFEINLPAGLQAKLQGSGSRKGFAGAFVMGLVLGPLAAPCVGPVIASVLVGIAQQGDVTAGALQLFVFALGMGVLFMAVGTFSASLPRSGDWLTRFKHGMGLVVLGFAAWNVRLVVPEWANFAMWTVVALASAAVFGAFDPAEGLVGNLRKGFALLLLACGVLLGVRAVETYLKVPLLPAGSGSATPKDEHPGWMVQDLESAQAKAKAEGKLVLVDIYADWCAQCKELDEKTWPDPQVRAWIEQHAVAVRVDTDKVRKDLAKTLQIRSYPTVILLDADGRETRRILGFHKPEAMMAFLNQP